MRNLAVFCGALALAACGSAPERKERPPAVVGVEAVGRIAFSDSIDAVGTALANEQVVLSAPVTERITSIRFSDGAFVPKGQIIATLAQSQENASLAAAEARVLVAGQQLKRVQELREHGFATNSNLEQQIAVADQARATAEEARAMISDRVIRAPFAGWVSLRTVSPGAIVTAGTQIATVSDVSRIKLDFTVPETRLASLVEGQTIEARGAAYPDRVFHGTIATIDPVIDPVTRAVKVRAILPNPDRTLKPGMLLTVGVLTKQREALAVPELSVVGEGEERFVFLAGEDGKAKRVPVKVGGRQFGMVEITDGLALGQRIVTEGVVKLTDGAPIEEPGKKTGQVQARGVKRSAPVG